MVLLAKRSRTALLALLLLLGAVLSGCAADTVTPATSATAPARTATLRPSPTGTAVPPSPTPERTATRSASPMPTATPTATVPAGFVYTAAGRITVPVLMYHHISDKGNTPYITRVADFRAQMQALHDLGYQTISITTLAEAVRQGGYLPEKAVVITFDDGYLDVYENAFPIMEEFGFTGVAYIITKTFEKGSTYGYMQVEHLKTLVRAGWEIGSHTVSHANLKTTQVGFGNELSGSKKTLEEKLGVEVLSFSYPYAAANSWIAGQVEKYGYTSAVGVDIFVTHSARRLFFLSRREVARGTSPKAFEALLVPGEWEIAASTPAPELVQP